MALFEMLIISRIPSHVFFRIIFVVFTKFRVIVISTLTDCFNYNVAFRLVNTEKNRFSVRISLLNILLGEIVPVIHEAYSHEGERV